MLTWPSSKRYVLGSVANWVVFLGAVAFLTWSKAAGHPRALSVAVVLALALSVAGQFVAAYRLIARQDEYVRAVVAKGMITASGVTLTLGVLWGLSVQFLGAPNGPLWLLYPVFWGVFGIVSPFLRSSEP